MSIYVYPRITQLTAKVDKHKEQNKEQMNEFIHRSINHIQIIPINHSITNLY
jgi:hypothetical protein